MKAYDIPVWSLWCHELCELPDPDFGLIKRIPIWWPSNKETASALIISVNSVLHCE